jgi:sec-independent protein translocase protein TatA
LAPIVPILLFDISGGELMLILLFVLLFFGAKGIPDIARTMGRAMRQFRDASDQVQREITKGAREVRQGMDEQQRAFTSQTDDPPKSSSSPVPPQPPPAS